jgi:GNAT superfamily N-acetyltransferase
MARPILCHTAEYQLARLTDADRPAAQALLVRCSDYYQLVEGHSAPENAVDELYTDVAPGKTLDDKLLLGVWTTAGVLVGVLDAMRDYPAAGEWFIGLMLIDPPWRGQGVGAQVYRAFAAWAKGGGARVLGLGVVEANVKALRFWQQMGFETARRTPPRPFGNKTHIVIMLRQTL